MTIAPGSTAAITNGCSDADDPSLRTAKRQRPKPFGSLTSMATPTRTFLPLARPPLSPCSSPPMNVSSTSTIPVRRSRPGRTSTDRNRCSIVQAVSYEPISSVRWRLSAEMPSLALAKAQQAANQTVSGVLVRWKIVPAVTDVRCPHAVHIQRPSPVYQPPAESQSGQTNPFGHRSHSR